MADTLLELENICKYYTGGQSVVVGLSNVDLTFRIGEFVAVTGESGSGKSTLAQVISGILPYESGEMRIRGKPTSHYDGSDWERYRRESISYISQNYGILPGSTVLTNVVSALRILGLEKDQALKRAEELLKMVELWELRSRRAAKLSSGQKQRLSIARALAKPAPILVADEPTGNLDQENSAKVIGLLARAAKERLVILITHDFQEAEGFATRRIILQDGKIALDAPLEAGAETAKAAAVTEKRPGRVLSPYITGLQVSGRPVWSAVVGLFFALTAFAVFAFLGTFIVNLDDTSTRIYDDSAFVNGDMTRIVVQRSDLEPMTEEDYGALLSVRYVQTLERSGYLADWNYAWQYGVDYEIHVNVENRGGDEDRYKIINQSVEIRPHVMDFVQTVPLFAQDREFLTEGRLPETMYEVVACDPELLGAVIDVYIHEQKEWSVGSYVHIEATVVGITDYGSGLYFADELGRVVRNYMAGGGVENGIYLTAPVYDRFATIERTVLETDFLKEGNLPAGTGQVALPGGEELIGTYISCIDAVVVGVTERGAVLYRGTEIDPALSEDETIPPEERELLHTLTENVLFYVRVNEEDPALVDLYLGGDGVCAIAEALYARREEIAARYDSEMAVGVYDLSGGGIENPEDYVTLQVALYNDSTFTGFLNVTPEMFDSVAWQGNSNQVSVFIEDYAYTDRVLEQLQSMGYLAISPFQQGSTEKQPALAQQRMQTLLVCLAALAAVVVLQLLVLKELFGVQLDSYKLLADMGLGCRAAQRSLCWQILLFALAGQLLGFGAICACAGLCVQRIVSVMRYLPAANWLILVLTHLAVSVAAGLWVMRTMKRRIYPQSGRQGDLDLDSEEAV